MTNVKSAYPAVANYDPDHDRVELAAQLREEAEALERLIADAQRLRQQIYEHLDRLQHPRDGCSAPEQRKWLLLS